MKFSQLLEQVEGTYLQTSDPQITGVTYDSRRVEPGYLFVCIPGLKTDGHLFAEQALAKGACALITERSLTAPADTAVFQVPDARKALALTAGNFYNHPSRHLKVIGVTGTNGKTTVTHLLQSILSSAGHKTGILGTLYAKIGDNIRDLGHTTPEAPDIEAFLADCLRAGAEYVVMEVSSHALAFARTAALDFHAAVFTNLTQDHLDYHQNMEDYLTAKLLLFRQVQQLPGSYCVVNQDDEHAEAFIKAAAVPAVTYGRQPGTVVRAADIRYDLSGSSFTLNYKEKSYPVNLQLIGNFSVYNALAALAVLLTEKLPPEIITQAISRIQGVPGRFEAVRAGQDFSVVVDYAHTPDGLLNILQTARHLTAGSVITVFGCGGDRDPGKRPKMGRIAEIYSDYFIITSDNPRSEDQLAIIKAVESGLADPHSAAYMCEPDRSSAIRSAVDRAQTGDIIVIAGKGHETYQLFKDRKIDFDDRAVALKWLKKRLGNES